MDRRRSLMAASESGGNKVFAITLYEGDSNENTVLLYNSLVAKSTFVGTWVTPLDDFEIVFVGTRTSYFDGVIISATYLPEYGYFQMRTQNMSNIANVILSSSGLVSLGIFG